MGPRSAVAAAHQASGLFAAGAVLAASAPLRSDVAREEIHVWATLLSVVLAVLAWRLPWHRWPPPATLALLPVALTMAALGSFSGITPTRSYGLGFAVIFAWAALNFPRRVAWAATPIMAIAYTLPLMGPAVEPPFDPAGLFAVVGACVLVAEIIGRSVEAAEHEKAAVDRTAAEHERAAMVDELTGLGSRRSARRLLDTVEPGDAIIFVDADHFKEVNDRFGHAAGDELLAKLGRFLRSHIRSQDGAARYGGEEFIVVARDVGTEARAIADRMVAAWQETKPLTTISAGVALRGESEPRTVTLARADAALYEAKRLGRNRAVEAIGDLGSDAAPQHVPANHDSSA